MRRICSLVAVEQQSPPQTRTSQSCDAHVPVGVIHDFLLEGGIVEWLSLETSDQVTDQVTSKRPNVCPPGPSYESLARHVTQHDAHVPMMVM